MDNLSTEDTTTELILSPMHPLCGGFTVYRDIKYCDIHNLIGLSDHIDSSNILI